MKGRDEEGKGRGGKGRDEDAREGRERGRVNNGPVPRPRNWLLTPGAMKVTAAY